MLITKKPPTDEKLVFAKMGAKKSKKPAVDIENAADAKKPGDKQEDAKKPVKKTKGKSKTAFFANKAAIALAGK